MQELLAFLEVVLGFVPVVTGGAIAIAAVVDALKKLGVLKNGYAQLVSLGLNAALFAAVYFLGDAHGDQITSVLAAIVAIAPVLVSLLMALGATKVAHNVLGYLGLGYSYSDKGSAG